MWYTRATLLACATSETIHKICYYLSALLPSLRVLLLGHDLHHWSLVRVSSMEYVHERCKSHETHKQHASPVEVHRCDLVRVREERPYEAPARVEQGYNVDRQASFAETPATLWQWQMKHATVGDAA